MAAFAVAPTDRGLRNSDSGHGAADATARRCRCARDSPRCVTRVSVPDDGYGAERRTDCGPASRPLRLVTEALREGDQRPASPTPVAADSGHPELVCRPPRPCRAPPTGTAEADGSPACPLTAPTG